MSAKVRSRASALAVSSGKRPCGSSLAASGLPVTHGPFSSFWSVAMSAMMGRLLKNDIEKSLVKAFPRNYPNILAREEKYAHMEEVFVKEAPASFAAIGQNKKHSPRWEERILQRSRSSFQKQENRGPFSELPTSKSLKKGSITFTISRSSFQKQKNGGPFSELPTSKSLKKGSITFTIWKVHQLYFAEHR